jgi:hypothetical protein
MNFGKLGPCSKCGDYVKPCRCSLEAEVKALKAELNNKCLLCEASTDARFWQAENEDLRQASEKLVDLVDKILWTAENHNAIIQDEWEALPAAARDLRQLIEGSK